MELSRQDPPTPEPVRAPAAVTQPQQHLRSLNDRAVIELLAGTGPMTRKQLARATGLSKPAATKIVTRLQADGIVHLSDGEDNGRPGPRAELVRLMPGLGLATGIEIRPTEARILHADVAGGLGDAVHRIPLNDGTDLSDQLRQALSLGLGSRPYRHRAVCIAVPGVLDPETADVFRDSGLTSWKPGHSVRIGAAIGWPVMFENDVNLHAIAERRLGAATNLDDFLLVSYGPGVGAAVVMDGRVRRGAHGAAGEVGLLATSDGVRHYEDVTRAWLGGHTAGLGPADAWTDRFDSAIDIDWDAVAAAISRGLASMSLMVDPSCIILAGPLCLRGGEVLRLAVARHLEECLPWHTPQVLSSGLDDDAVIHGAHLVAQHQVLDQFFTPDAN